MTSFCKKSCLSGDLQFCWKLPPSLVLLSGTLLRFYLSLWFFDSYNNSCFEKYPPMTAPEILKHCSELWTIFLKSFHLILKFETEKLFYLTVCIFGNLVGSDLFLQSNFWWRLQQTFDGTSWQLSFSASVNLSITYVFITFTGILVIYLAPLNFQKCWKREK